MSRYRVLVQHDPDRSVYVARAPELEHCSAEGATRAEAVAKVEEEIEAQLRNMREHGTAPPEALDDGAPDQTGEINARLSRTLQRDLTWQARLEGVELGQLIGEILAAGLETRRSSRTGRRSGNVLQAEPGQSREDAGPPRRGPGPGGGGDDRRPFRQDNRAGGGGRYHAIMEDRATFLEYVRGLENGGRGPGAQGGAGPGPGGGQGGSRRRGRGRFGPGGGQGEGGAQGGPTGGDEGPPK